MPKKQRKINIAKKTLRRPNETKKNSTCKQKLAGGGRTRPTLKKLMPMTTITRNVQLPNETKTPNYQPNSFSIQPKRTHLGSIAASEYMSSSAMSSSQKKQFHDSMNNYVKNNSIMEFAVPKSMPSSAMSSSQNKRWHDSVDNDLKNKSIMNDEHKDVVSGVLLEIAWMLTLPGFVRKFPAASAFFKTIKQKVESQKQPMPRSFTDINAIILATKIEYDKTSPNDKFVQNLTSLLFCLALFVQHCFENQESEKVHIKSLMNTMCNGDKDNIKEIEDFATSVAVVCDQLFKTFKDVFCYLHKEAKNADKSHNQVKTGIPVSQSLRPNFFCG